MTATARRISIPCFLGITVLLSVGGSLLASEQDENWDAWFGLPGFSFHRWADCSFREQKERPSGLVNGIGKEAVRVS